MIRIHTGVLPKEQLDDESLVIRDPAHYPIVRRHIHEALAREENLEVFVMTRVCDGWFWDLFDYHHDVIQIDDDPAERLKRKLSISTLPIDLAAKSDLIIELGLLDLPDPTDAASDVWKWIVHYKLGSVWAAEYPSKEHFSRLVGWYLENATDPILKPVVVRIAQTWMNMASGRLRSAYARLFDEPHKNAFSLIAWKALAPYDSELKEQWLVAEGWFSPKINDLEDIMEMPTQIPEAVRKKLNARIRTHWNTRLKEHLNA